ncbi:MAG: hypothetical protein ACD_75C02256G0001 [uncultured bacterium]|nr:MAG: hypothetical protein ACD_75C02256G0001 [uncultured bacterium]
MEKVSWHVIPSLENLEVDWEYTPENPLGKRAWARLSNNDLYRLLDADYIPVRIVARTFSDKGYLLDISVKGLAVLVDKAMKVGVLLDVGFFLGRYKVTAKAVVKNSNCFENNYRVGIEFIALHKEHAAFINGINSSKIYGHKR